MGHVNNVRTLRRTSSGSSLHSSPSTSPTSSPRGAGILQPRTDLDMAAQRAAVKQHQDRMRERHLEHCRMTNTTQLMSSVARRKILLAHLSEARRHQIAHSQSHTVSTNHRPQLDLTDKKEFQLVRDDIITLMKDKVLRVPQGKKPQAVKDNFDFTMSELALLRLWDF